MDVTSAFLYGDISEEIYMDKPCSFVTYFCLFYELNKSLYGLKHELFACYENNDQLFLNLGFKGCEYDHKMYPLHVDGDTLILALYFDDVVIT